MTPWKIISSICATILMLAALGSILWKAFEIHDGVRDNRQMILEVREDVRALNPAGALYAPTETPPDPEMYITTKVNADGDTVDIDTTWGE